MAGSHPHLQRSQLPISAANLSPSSCSTLLSKKISAVRVLETWHPCPKTVAYQVQKRAPSPSLPPPIMGTAHSQVGPAIFTRTLTQRRKVLEGISALRRHPRTQLSHLDSHSQESQPKSRAVAPHPCLSPEPREDKSYWGLGQSSGPTWDLLQPHCQSQAGSSLPFPPKPRVHARYHGEAEAPLGPSGDALSHIPLPTGLAAAVWLPAPRGSAHAHTALAPVLLSSHRCHAEVLWAACDGQG